MDRQPLRYSGCEAIVGAEHRGSAEPQGEGSGRGPGGNIDRVADLVAAHERHGAAIIAMLMTSELEGRLAQMDNAIESRRIECATRNTAADCRDVDPFTNEGREDITC
jgi:hypothetical protein